MKITQRFNRLTLWNKVGFIGGIASIVGLSVTVAALLRSPSPVAQVQYSPQISVDQLAAAVASRLSKPIPSQSDQPGIDGLSPAGPEPERILLLVDNSGSMSAYPVREAVLAFIGGLRRHDLVGMAVFSDSVAEVVPFGDYTEERFRGILRDLRLRGRFTDIRKGVAASARALAGTPGGAKRLVLFTDCLQDNRPHDTWPSQQDSYDLQGVRLDVVLFGPSGSTVEPSVLPRVDRIWKWPSAK